jgi:hypothetical protein
MDYQPRTIAFLAELYHPPLQPDPRPAQRLHNEMFGSREPAYSSFAVTPQGPVLSNPVVRVGATSQVSFLADRVQFREELGSMTCEGFAERVGEVGARTAQEREIQVFTGQQVTLRSLINPHSRKDARDFLREGMFRFGDEPELFQRAPQLYGLRLTFPPTESEPSTFSLRVESYNADPRSLFIEVQGAFGPVIVARGLEPLGERVGLAYDFLTERALPFVARFERGATEA